MGGTTEPPNHRVVFSYYVLSGQGILFAQQHILSSILLQSVAETSTADLGSKSKTQQLKKTAVITESKSKGIHKPCPLGGAYTHPGEVEIINPQPSGDSFGETFLNLGSLTWTTSPIIPRKHGQCSSRTSEDSRSRKADLEIEPLLLELMKMKNRPGYHQHIDGTTLQTAELSVTAAAQGAGMNLALHQSRGGLRSAVTHCYTLALACHSRIGNSAYPQTPIHLRQLSREKQNYTPSAHFQIIIFQGCSPSQTQHCSRGFTNLQEEAFGWGQEKMKFPLCTSFSLP